MKKLTTIVSALVIGFVILSGCGGTTTTAPAPTTTVTVTPTPAPTRETVFVNMVKRDIPAMAVIPDATLVGFGHRVCDALAPAAPINQAQLGAFAFEFYRGGKGMFTAKESAQFVGYSIGAFCPQVYPGGTST